MGWLTKDNAFKILIYIMWIFLLFSIVLTLFKNLYMSLINSIYLLVLLFVYFKFKKIPLHTQFLLGLFFVFTVLGEVYLGLYYESTCSSISMPSYYDKFIHFFGAIVLCSVIYALTKNKIKNKKILLLFAASASISIEVLWEFYEFFFDYFFEARFQGVYSIPGDESFCGAGMLISREGSNAVLVMDALTDTILDLLLAFFGALIFYFSNVLYFERDNLKLKKKK